MIDISANRRKQKWSRREQAGRLLWALARPAFSWSPRPLWGWRRMLLRLFGARVGREVHIYPTVRITIPWNVTIGDYSAVGDRALLYSLGRITIGERVTISQQAHLCAGTHDYRKPDFPLVKAPIGISAGVWICADAFVGPNVVVGKGAILGARGVAMKNVPPGVIAAGNPARVVKVRPEEMM